MWLTFLVTFVLLVPTQVLSKSVYARYGEPSGVLRFSCSQLVTERLDPIVSPGAAASQHLHQVVGGNSFSTYMSDKVDISTTSSCTTCTFSEDFSNYWTASLYFRSRNGTFKLVPQRANLGFDDANGGMTIYYIASPKSNTTAFKPGFRMLVGNPTIRTEPSNPRDLTFTCLDTMATREPESAGLPTRACKEGIMANIRFPTCWDGVSLDSPTHTTHVAYPINNGTFDNGTCPSTHPVVIPQVFYETIWDTRQFNDASLWPVDGSQPFVWSYGDRTGYGTHGDYVFGWKGDALQRAMDSKCYVECDMLKNQTIAVGNACSVAPTVKEPIDGWLTSLPGKVPITGPNVGSNATHSAKLKRSSL